MRKPHIGAELASQVKRVLLENMDLERDRKSAFERPGPIRSDSQTLYRSR
jgi:hypothetical protein